LTRWRVRQPRHLRHRPVSTVRNHRVLYVRTGSHHSTRTGYPRVVPRVRRRRRGGRGVGRVGGGQPHVGVPQVGVAVGGAEARVYGAHARQPPVRDALRRHQVDVGQVVQREVLTRHGDLVRLQRVQLEARRLEALSAGVQRRRDGRLHHGGVVVAGVVHVWHVTVVVLAVLRENR
jgi:hypothetical protein